MVEELEVLWQKLSFTEEEDEDIELDTNSTKVAMELGKNCVVMKIVTHKSIIIKAMRKKVRMLWKPNKGVQIYEVEEDMFLVEFEDGKDKKKVLDMCPWSNEKQLILMQEFEGKLTLKEIEMKWSPFWVQIFNLPLNCKTKEIGWPIRSKLGEVVDVDVDVSDVEVQWGRCLSIRVRLDVTKKLVQGKKITVEGGECKWVNLKCKRLPNFCYWCGLLSHALKDCPENVSCNNQIENMELQDRAWLRGEIIRRNVQEQAKYVLGRGKEAGTW
nr:uncharacterized protein CFP56_37629 [Quercus suber]